MSNKIFLIIILFIGFLYILYRDGANIVFAFDKTEGVAQIIDVKGDKVRLSYYNKYMDKNIQFDFLSKKSILEGLHGAKKWKIIYSKKNPSRVSLVGITVSPVLTAFSSFYILLLIGLPLIILLFIKDIE